MAEMAVTRVRAGSGTRTVMRRVARNGWSARRERTFLETLAVTSNVAASAKAAKVSDTAVYRRRQTDPAFSAAWTKALCEGYARLEMVLLDRAIRGVPKTVAGSGGKTVKTREFSDRLGLSLLAQHARTVGEERARIATLAVRDAGPSPVQMLIDRLADMSARMAEPATDGASPIGDAAGDGDVG